jgi:hypothetical protein
MGIANPRPAMRKGEARRINAQLTRLAELTAQFISEGMTADDASKKAFQIITGKPLPARPE